MTKGPLVPIILKFAVPLMLSSVLQLLYNAADIVVVGRFAPNGTAALAAVGSTGALINLLVNLFMGLSVGASIVASQHFGAGRHKDLSDTVHTCMVVAAVSGVALSAFGYFSARTLLTWMDSPDGVLDLATLYMQIYFLGMPFNLIYNFGAAILRAVGDTKRPLYILFASGLVNVVLNLIFVIGFGMSVDGVAWATVSSQVLSAACVVALMVRTPGASHLDWRKLRMHGQKLVAVARCGIPAGVQGMMFSISNVLIQKAINSFQEITVAGSSAASNIEGFVYVIMNAFAQAAMTVTAQNAGAKDAGRVRKTLLVCLGLVTVCGLAVGQAAVLFGTQLSSLYNSDPEVIRVSCERMAIVCGFYFMCGIMDVLVGSLRGIGLSLLPTVVTVGGVCGLRILWINTVFAANPSMSTLLYSYPVSWLITEIVHAVCFIIYFRRKKAEWACMPQDQALEA